MPRPRSNPLPPLPKGLLTESPGKKIANLRKLRGKTQTELAELIGIARSHLGNIELDLIHLSDDLIIRFAAALKVSTDEILGYKSRATLENSIPNLKLIKRMQKIQTLSLSNQKMIIHMIDTHLKGLGVNQNEQN